MIPTVKIAFYAPLKSPNHPVPSGDRQLAKHLIEALRQSGFEVKLISELRSYLTTPTRSAQAKLEKKAQNESEKIISEIKESSWQPDLWFTYHLYHKALDLLGPQLSQHWNIPYVLAEASYSPKQIHGPWASQLPLLKQTLLQANLVISINPKDQIEVDKLRLDAGLTQSRYLAPFINTKAIKKIPGARDRLSNTYHLPKDTPWLLTVAMIRSGDKLASYQLLINTLKELVDVPWHWIVIGDGLAKQRLEKEVKSFASRTLFLGEKPQNVIWQWMKSANLFVWPGINEAIGIVSLEAQACSLPVITGYNAALGALEGKGVTLLEGISKDKFKSSINHELQNLSLPNNFSYNDRQAQSTQLLKSWLLELVYANSSPNSSR